MLNTLSDSPVYIRTHTGPVLGQHWVYWCPSTAFWSDDIINTLRPRQNGRHFTNNIFNCIFLNENVSISIRISLKFVPKSLNNNIPTLVQIMAWRWLGENPLSEPTLVSLLTYICVTRTQWVTLDYSRIIRPIPSLLMPWLLASPGHQQQYYWICRINGPLSSMNKDNNYLHFLSVKNW